MKKLFILFIELSLVLWTNCQSLGQRRPSPSPSLITSEPTTTLLPFPDYVTEEVLKAFDHFCVRMDRKLKYCVKLNSKILSQD